MSLIATHVTVKEQVLWWGYPVQGLRLRPVHFLFGPFGIAWALSEAARRKRTEYLLTEDRVMIGEARGQKLELRVLPLVSIPDPVLKLHDDGGTIVFTTADRSKGREPPARFELGPEARHVFGLLTRAQAQAVARWPIAPPPRSR